MKVQVSEDVQFLINAVESVLLDHSSPERVRKAWADPSHARSTLWPQLCGIGLTNLTRSEDQGGGLSLEDVMPLMELAGRHVVAVPLVESVGVACPVLAIEPGAQAAEVLEQVQSGEAFVTVQDGWDGWAPWAGLARFVLVIDRDEVAVCEAGDEEIATAQSQDGSRRLGQMSRASRRWTLQQPAAAQALRARALVATAANLNGVAEGALLQAVEYATIREQFGQPIGSFQAIRHRLAAAYSRLEFTRRYAYYAAWSVASGQIDSAVAARRAKAVAGDVAGTASYAALQTFGGVGYTWECDLHLWMKRIQALDGAYGTSDHHWRALADRTGDEGHLL